MTFINAMMEYEICLYQVISKEVAFDDVLYNSDCL